MYDNLVSLTKYLKVESIKELIGDNYVYIDSLDSAEQIAHSIAQNELTNIVFESSVIKNRFFSELKRMRPDVTIICCTSTLQRFKRNVEESSDLIIYNNINKCENSDILNIIKENKGVFVC